MKPWKTGGIASGCESQAENVSREASVRYSKVTHALILSRRTLDRARPILSPTGTTEELQQAIRDKTPYPVDQQFTEEVTLERCTCGYDRGHVPEPTCVFCEGSGWWATKRILRPAPKPDFSEQSALAQLKTKDMHLLMAAKTIETAADLLERAGKAKDAAQTRQAAKAVRATVEGEG